MYMNRKQARTLAFRVKVTAAIALLSTSLGFGQAETVDFVVTEGTQRMEMVVNSSRILTMDRDIPRVLVNNREIVRVTPISPTQVQVSALAAGVTQINLWDTDGAVRSVDVIVYPDARRLEMVLRAEFPNAAIRVRPLDNSVILAGYVDRPEVIGQVVAIAEDFYPKVINNISVGGVQQVALHARVMEVSRTKLRALSADFFVQNGLDTFVSSAAGIITSLTDGNGGFVGSGADTVSYGVINGNDRFSLFIEALRRNEMVKILAEPTLVTVSGRPASFQEGGEFPIVVAQGIGANSVEFKQFGTRVDFIPIVLGNGNIRLEVRPQVSEIDNSRGVDLGGNVVPGLRTRWVDTAAEMRSGQTLALAGLIQTRIEASNRGLPWLADLPWTGALFRRNSDEMNEIELLVTVRPELVAALDPHQVPPTGPGEHTVPPNDIDFYFRGYNEVPRCCPDTRCTTAGGIPTGAMGSNMMSPGATMPAGPMVPTPANPMSANTMMMPASTSNSSGANYTTVPSGGFGPEMTRTHQPSMRVGPAQRAPSNEFQIQNIHTTAPNSTNGQAPGTYEAPNPANLGPSGYDSLDF